jgi:hypothetical protein
MIVGCLVPVAVHGSSCRRQIVVPIHFRPDADACNRAMAADDAAGLPAFDTRVELGEAAERNEEFRSFHAAVERAAGDHLAETMRSCFATGQNPNTAAFVLVADIGAEGTAKAIEVRPATNIARCFAAGFATARFPVPPPHAGHDGFPVTIKMRID